MALNYHPTKMDKNLGPVNCNDYTGISTWEAYNLFDMDRHGRLLSRVGSQEDNNPQDMLPTFCESGVAGGRQMDRSDTCPSHIYRNVSDTHRDITASWDVPVVYIIIEQLQLRIRDIEEELTRLRAKTSHCDHGGRINRQTDTANVATQHESTELQDNSPDHSENDHSTELH